MKNTYGVISGLLVMSLFVAQPMEAKQPWISKKSMLLLGIGAASAGYVWYKYHSNKRASDQNLFQEEPATSFVANPLASVQSAIEACRQALVERSNGNYDCNVGEIEVNSSAFDTLSQTEKGKSILESIFFNWNDKARETQPIYPHAIDERIRILDNMEDALKSL